MSHNPNPYLRENLQALATAESGVIATYNRKLVLLDKEALKIDTAIIEARREQNALKKQLRDFQKAGRDIFDMSDPGVFQLQAKLKRLKIHLNELAVDLENNWAQKRELREELYVGKADIRRQVRSSSRYALNLKMGKKEIS